MGLMKPSQWVGSTKATTNARESTVSFEKDIVFGRKLDEFSVLVVVVGVKRDLLQVKPTDVGPTRRLVPGLQRGRSLLP